MCYPRERESKVVRWICKAFAILCLVIGTGCATSERSPQSRALGAPLAATQSAALDLIVLGSGGPDAVGRASTCFVLSLDGSPRILIDAGSGAFVRLGEAGLSLDHLDLILLTHLHIDHTGELPGILLARAVGSRGPADIQNLRANRIRPVSVDKTVCGSAFWRAGRVCLSRGFFFAFDDCCNRRGCQAPGRRQAADGVRGEGTADRRDCRPSFRCPGSCLSRRLQRPQRGFLRRYRSSRIGKSSPHRRSLRPACFQYGCARSATLAADSLFPPHAPEKNR